MSKVDLKSFLIFHVKDVDVIDPWTVVFPDGSVFTFGDTSTGYPDYKSYLCQYSKFKPRKFEVPLSEKEFASLPKEVITNIMHNVI